LFGSRARGDADPDSDMDVLVIVDDLSPELEDYISECA
jgi:predicted nucleotidyltransferase